MRFHVLVKRALSARGRAGGPTALTSTCSEDQLSMLKDLILEICVPSFRCSAAQRMQRKIPIYRRRTVSLRIRSEVKAMTYIPTCPSYQTVSV
jgi:hypothetical protein